MWTLESWRLRRPEWFSGAVIDFAPPEGNGWGSIVDELFETIETALLTRPSRSFCIGQAKEKLGSLRVYFRVVPDDPELRCIIQEAVEKALTRSAMTCMICGCNGNVFSAPGCATGFDAKQCLSNVKSRK